MQQRQSADLNTCCHCNGNARVALLGWTSAGAFSTIIQAFQDLSSPVECKTYLGKAIQMMNIGAANSVKSAQKMAFQMLSPLCHQDLWPQGHADQPETTPEG